MTSNELLQSTLKKQLVEFQLHELSSVLNNDKWKVIGRQLKIPHNKLLGIEGQHRSDAYQECAFDMLLLWREIASVNCTAETLLDELLKLNMNNTAHQVRQCIFKLEESDGKNLQEKDSQLKNEESTEKITDVGKLSMDQSTTSEKEIVYPMEGWETPMQWISSDKDGKLHVNASTAKSLEEIKQRMVVISIAGSYRTGKSFLMNWLAGKNIGFALGNTVQSETKGIWVWCMKHPERENDALVLIDTEGLGDTAKGDVNFDMKILSLALLLSTTFIYNVMGKMDNHMITDLHFLSELTKFIKVKKSSDGSNEMSNIREFAQHFPHFILVIRDFMLQLKIAGKIVTPKEYFEHVLEMKEETRRNRQYNFPRKAILEAFKKRDCFVFPRPVIHDELFPKLSDGNIDKSEMNPRFLRLAKEFYTHVISVTSVKAYKDANQFNGSMLVNAAEGYVNTMNSSDYACVESTMYTVLLEENRKLVTKVMEKYIAEMESITLPTSAENLKEMSDKVFHDASKDFEAKCIQDVIEEPRKMLKKQFEDFFMNMSKRNKEESVMKCENLAKQLTKFIEEKFIRGEYIVKGGIVKYDEDVDKMIKEFDQKADGCVNSEETRKKLIENPPYRQIVVAHNSMLEDKDNQITILQDSHNDLKLEYKESCQKKIASDIEKDRQIAVLQAAIEDMQLKYFKSLEKIQRVEKQSKDALLKYEESLQQIKKDDETQLRDVRMKYEESQEKIKDLEKQLKDAERKYEESFQQNDKDAEQQLRDAQLKYEESIQKINDEEKQLIEAQSRYEESLEKLQDVEKQFTDAALTYEQSLQENDENALKQLRDAQWKYEESLQKIKDMEKQLRDVQSKYKDSVQKIRNLHKQFKDVLVKYEQSVHIIKNVEKQSSDAQLKYEVSVEKIQELFQQQNKAIENQSGVVQLQHGESLLKCNEKPSPLEGWEKPMQWISQDGEGKLFVNPTTAQKLEEIKQPVVIIAIAGLYRTGKSFLMNRLAGRNTGFALGNYGQRETEGIWIWCLQHPAREDECLVLIDTQGLSRFEEGDKNFNTNIFSLAILLSSTFIYNICEEFDDNTITNMQLVSEITKNIQVKPTQNKGLSNKSDVEPGHFPDFILAVRDCTQQFQITGQNVTPNDYFERILVYRVSNFTDLENFNRPREVIRDVFASHCCFTFPRPVNDFNQLDQLQAGKLGDSDLNSKFVEEIEAFYNHVVSKSSVKKYKNVFMFNGSRLVTASREYVQAMNDGDLPCIESMGQTVVEEDNIKCVTEAVAYYCSAMELITSPITEETFKEKSDKAFKDARKYFEENCGRVILEFSDMLNQLLEESVEEMFKRNEEVRRTKCEEKVKQLNNDLKETQSGVEYNVKGGCEKYKQDVAEIIEEFDQVPYKGVKADEIRKKSKRFHKRKCHPAVKFVTNSKPYRPDDQLLGLCDVQDGSGIRCNSIARN